LDAQRYNEDQSTLDWFVDPEAQAARDANIGLIDESDCVIGKDNL
jgi:hypothetical protein